MPLPPCDTGKPIPDTRRFRATLTSQLQGYPVPMGCYQTADCYSSPSTCRTEANDCALIRQADIHKQHHVNQRQRTYTNIAAWNCYKFHRNAHYDTLTHTCNHGHAHAALVASSPKSRQAAQCRWDAAGELVAAEVHVPARRINKRAAITSHTSPYFDRSQSTNFESCDFNKTTCGVRSQTSARATVPRTQYN
jgi:hypothetical protein